MAARTFRSCFIVLTSPPGAQRPFADGLSQLRSSLLKKSPLSLRVTGEGARLPIRLALNNIKDLRNIVGYLHHKFGLTSNGMFSIQQSGSCWHGVGAENLLQAVEQWRERYAQSPSKTFHHSEEFIYFDQFRDGWIELSSQQRIDSKLRGSFLHHSELVIQLPGVPVDTSPFLKLCRYTSNEWANFEYIGERWTSRIRLKKPVNRVRSFSISSIAPFVSPDVVKIAPTMSEVVRPKRERRLSISLTPTLRF